MAQWRGKWRDTKMSDGAYTTGIPVVTNTLDADLPEILENFDYLRRMWMMTSIVPINNTTITYTYDGSNNLTGITFSGALTGSATFTYTSGNLTQEVWTLYAKTITINHTYSGNNLSSSAVTVA